MTCSPEVKVLPVQGESYKLVTGLLPCPFCGDGNLLLKHQDDGKNQYHYLACRVHSCLMGRTRSHRSIEKLFRLWNNRISRFAMPMVEEKPKPKRSWLHQFFFGE